MAQRRMFSQRIVGDESFLEMPSSSQCLYFHLGIYADDDGFVNPQKVVRMIGANPDDLKVLITKNFVIPMDGGVVVVTHWKENNYIQNDRYTPTIYQEQKDKLECIQNVYKLDTQVRLGKDRLELGKDTSEPSSQDIPVIIKLFETINPTCSKFYGNKTQRGAVERLIKLLGFEQLKKIIAILPKTNASKFAPTITTPLQLEDNLAKLKSYLDREKLQTTNKTITI